MKCEDLDKLLTDYITGDLEQELNAGIRKHLDSCEACSDKAAELGNLLSGIVNLPEDRPSPALRKRFEEMIDVYENAAADESGFIDRLNNRFGSWMPRKPVMQLAAALLVFFAGLLSGTSLFDSSDKYTTEIVQVRSEMNRLNRLVALTLIEQSSANKRLQGVNMIAAMDHPDNTLMEILIDMISEDPNINIRLASIEALGNIGENKLMVTKIVSALLKQTSPLVQIGIIEFLVTINEENAVNIFTDMLKQNGLDAAVKERLELAVVQLQTKEM